MLIVDHINLFWDSPLIGRNDDSIGPRFVDMSDAYSSELNDLFLKVAAQEQITLHRGIYTAGLRLIARNPRRIPLFTIYWN